VSRFTAVSLLSGAGELDWGFKEVGLSLIFANDALKPAVRTCARIFDLRLDSRIFIKALMSMDSRSIMHRSIYDILYKKVAEAENPEVAFGRSALIVAKIAEYGKLGCILARMRQKVADQTPKELSPVLTSLDGGNGSGGL